MSNAINLDGFVEKCAGIVERHRLQAGAYCRYLWQNEQQNRKMGVNEYGCADAANILYTIGRFPRDPAEREASVRVLRGQQNPETGLFWEGTHHTIHTTAHCLAALELFDAQPEHPLTALLLYLDREKLYAFLAGLQWEDSPWNNSHQGAGLYASMVITRTCPLSWQHDYFTWLREHADPETGLGLKERNHGQAPMAHQLFGWFHYFFNHEYARQPIPYPDRLIDTCIDLYRGRALGARWAREIGFMEIDWVFAMNRASRQTAHRFAEVKELLRDCAQDLIPWLETLDPETHEGLNDLHMLFGTVCVLAELQLALPGEIETTVPLKSVLDRRPFI